MYKLLLCWRYLLTRYLAFACIVSVMLGVATLVVVNSVMAGFSSKLKDRLHGLLSDVLIEVPTLEGFGNVDIMMRQIRQDPVIGGKIEAMTPTMEIFAMLQFNCRGEKFTRPVRLVGIDPEGRAEVGGFAEYLVRQKNDPKPSFQLSVEARDRFDRWNPPVSMPPPETPLDRDVLPPPMPPPSDVKRPEGIIVGYAIASYRRPAEPGQPAQDDFYLEPGDAVQIITAGGNTEKLSAVTDSFVVCDYFKSEMSEYDSNYVFVPLKQLQHIRTMEDRVTNLQIRLKNYADARAVVDRLKEMYDPRYYHIVTWEEKQGPLLSAIAIERGLLNVLLFLIIGVAGFGILAIFTMIVAEKTRDIGILKALGASNGGVMKIFLGYGLLLGLIGAFLGSILGLGITLNINDLEHFLTRLTGQEIFPRSVYYFDKIPTFVQPLTVVLTNLGALVIAVLASVLPALRAALLHPVRALRYE